MSEDVKSRPFDAFEGGSRVLSAVKEVLDHGGSIETALDHGRRALLGLRPSTLTVTDDPQSRIEDLVRTGVEQEREIQALQEEVDRLLWLLSQRAASPDRSFEKRKAESEARISERIRLLANPPGETRLQ